MHKPQNSLRFDAFRQKRNFMELKTNGAFGDPTPVFALFFIGFSVLIVANFMSLLNMALFLGLMVGLVVLLIKYVLRQEKLLHDQEVRVLQRFAKDNNFELSRNEHYYSDGIIFAFGNDDHRTGWMLCGKVRDYPLAMYWHYFSSGSRSSSYYYHYAVAEIDLPKSLPHIFLANRNNNTRMAGKEELDVFNKEHLLELEGDFPRHFKVYANKNQAAYVLTILNPAFMQALVDGAAQYDLELIGKKAFLYFPRRWGPAPEEIKSLWEGADFIAKQLKKQLDTFGSDKSKTKLGISTAKISFKGL